MNTNPRERESASRGWTMGFCLTLGLLCGGALPAGAQDDDASVTDTSYLASDGTRVLQQSIVVPASIEDVWEAFTTAEGLQTWAVPFARVDFRLGGIWESSYSLAASEGDKANIKNRYLAYQPLRMLAIQAVQAPPGFPHAELLASLWSVIELEPLDARRVRVTASGVGYRNEPGFQEIYAQFEAGNAWSLQQLHRRFAEGPIDWSSVLGQ